MKILIAGDGKVGEMLTRQLSAEGHDITLIDSDADVLESSIEQYDVMSVVGNCASMETLRQAGVDEADLLITATSSDETNLLCCMIASGMNPNIHTIARIRTPEYSETVNAMNRQFALSLTVNPEKQTAAEIAHLLQYPEFLRRETFAHGLVEIVEIRIRENSKLSGEPLYRMESIVHCQTLVCAVVRDGQAVIPGGDFVLQTGDRVFVTASTTNLATFLKNLGIITKKMKNALLVGGGRICYYLASQLIREGVSVKIIDNDPERCEILAEHLPKACIVEGDASMHSTMIKEGVEDVDALVLLTGMDELNIVLGVYGASLNVPRVVTKLGRADNTKILDALSLGSVVSPKELCCDTIVRYVRAMQNQVGAAASVHSIADGQAEAIEFIVDGQTKNCGRMLKDIRFRKNVLLASITRRGQIIFPKGDTTFEPGDRLVVVATGTKLISRINDIFED